MPTGKLPHEASDDESPEGTVDLLSEALYRIGTLAMSAATAFLDRAASGDEEHAEEMLRIARFIAEAGIMAEAENHAFGHCLVDRNVTDWTVCRYLKVKSLREQRRERRDTNN